MPVRYRIWIVRTCFCIYNSSLIYTWSCLSSGGLEQIRRRRTIEFSFFAIIIIMLFIYLEEQWTKVGPPNHVHVLLLKAVPKFTKVHDIVSRNCASFSFIIEGCHSKNTVVYQKQLSKLKMGAWVHCYGSSVYYTRKMKGDFAEWWHVKTFCRSFLKETNFGTMGIIYNYGQNCITSEACWCWKNKQINGRFLTEFSLKSAE